METWRHKATWQRQNGSSVVELGFSPEVNNFQSQVLCCLLSPASHPHTWTETFQHSLMGSCLVKILGCQRRRMKGREGRMDRRRRSLKEG